MTGEAVRQLLGRRRLAAGLAAMPPHDHRRTYAGDLLDAGADRPEVQQLLGHASPANDIEIRPSRRPARRAAAERLHLVVPSAATDLDEESPRALEGPL